MKFLPENTGRIIRFVCVGLFVSLLDVGLTWGMLAWASPYWAVSFGFVAGLLASYLLHAKMTFAVPLRPGRQIPRFVILVGINYLETIGIVCVAVDGFGASALWGKLASLPCVALTSYLFSAHWIFKDKRRAS
ncbi:MAG: GtrA family protein [Zoogloeaceae bacterium]|jgi:putative flippase GtrA|nr:GtrA family protein [Zoogloeaceae bacterium]